MHREKKCIAALCCLAVLAVFPVGSVLAGPPPASLAAPAARALVRGPELGGRTSLPVADPQKAAALGLPGLAAGDTVDVAHPAKDVWTVTDPKTGRTVETRREPDLGQ